MFLDKEYFDGWMQRLSERLERIEKLCAGAPDMANALYEKFVAMCRERVPKVETGRFGADMKVSLENDGPFTILIDSEDF